MDTPLNTPASADASLKEMSADINFYRKAPDNFFAAWKRGVQIAGYRYFGDGTKEGFTAATDKWKLVPSTDVIKKAMGVMSPGEAKFLAAMVCFYNDAVGKKLCTKAGLKTVLDLTGFDLGRRRVVTDLILSYCGW